MAYHVNPQTGVPAICQASSGRCPFGGDADHYDTPAEAVKSFESSFVSAIPTPAAKPRKDELATLTEAKEALALAKHDLNKYPSGSAERRRAFEFYNERREAYADEIRKLEDRGLGHVIPDDGPTLRVATRAQKILLEEELMGQLSDGHWENLQQRDWQNGGKDHWEIWADAQVIVDPKNVGRNFRAGKDNYQLNAKDLLDVVGDRMVESVQQGGDTNYDDRKMRQDLSGLRKIFKTQRSEHTGSDDMTPSIMMGGATPAKTSNIDTSSAIPLNKPAGLPTAPVQRKSGGTTSSYAMNMGDHGNPAMVSAAMAGPGRQLPMDRYFSRHCGMANPITGDGDDYDHIKDGGVVIVGKADGSRARVIAGAGEQLADPGAELGRPIEQTKQSDSGRDNVRSDLYILGYRDRNGNKFGYVPDKKIQYFVFK